MAVCPVRFLLQHREGVVCCTDRTVPRYADWCLLRLPFGAQQFPQAGASVSPRGKMGQVHFRAGGPRRR